MKKKEFWDIYEDGWTGIPYSSVHRSNMAIGDVDSLDGKCESLPQFLRAMRERFVSMTDDEVREFDRILGRTLYDLDRPELHRYSNGSNDKFHYNLRFVVAIGKVYHDAIDKDESLAMFSVRYDCEEMTYVLLSTKRSDELYPFDEPCVQQYDRESFQNKEAWARARS
jgi:hypothetical protein